MDKRIKGTLRSYLRWPLILSIFLLAVNIHIYTFDTRAGVVMTCYLIIYIIIAIALYSFKRSSLLKDLVHYCIHFNTTGERLMEELTIPIAILDEDGKCLWTNYEFSNIFDENGKKHQHISDYIHAITASSLPTDPANDVEMHFHIDETYYKALLQKVSLVDTDTKRYAGLGFGEAVIFLYIYDETEIVSYIRENRNQRLAVGLLYIDNYDETLETIEEVRRSLLSALIDRKINKYMMSIDAITKKLEKDKYIFLFQYKYLAQLQNDKFSLLEEIKNLNSGDDINVTISIGIGVQAETFKKRQEYARTAIDLALGRGGDQVVVKTPENILYYGGKSMQLEKNTRVKARVKAHALKESMVAAEEIVIMGHNLPDVDVFGAAIGIYRIAKTLGKKAHIVINQANSSLKPLLQLFTDNSEYEDDMIISGDEGKALINNSTMLVVVDVNRPALTDAPELLERTNTVVILDHHRQTGEFFKNPVLSYVEPSASSTCEMVAEILQYVDENVKLRPVEADALYSGIMIDTNNFMNKPGIRTFEAVAYLRRNGADITRIRKLFRTDMNEYKVRAEAIQNTETFMGHFAIARCNGHGLESPTIVGAKISDELLNIEDIKASFVLTAWENKIYISARSIDEVNVQLIMERLGGGGHAACAGAQLEDCTIEEATKTLQNTLQTMHEEGDL